MLRLTRNQPSGVLVPWEFAAFNLGCAGVLAGTLSKTLVLADAGSAMVFAALCLFAWSTKVALGRRIEILGYRVVLVVLAVSVPAGAVLAYRAGP
ncbi:MAG: hypothetical protein ACRDVP_06820 [Acidimicrobiales bacterium]